MLNNTIPLRRFFTSLLDDYHKADKDGKQAASHLLSGYTEIPMENEIQIIRCVTLVNLNPRNGATIFEKTGFDRPSIRRFVPCDLDALELPDLKRTGQEALDLAENAAPLEIKQPISSCRECREELLGYLEGLFTKEGQKCIDIDGLLNIARGFTGYGFSASEAIRYVLYKATLIYHTLGWVQEKWVQGFREKKLVTKVPRIGIKTPEIVTPEEIEKEQKIEKTPVNASEFYQRQRELSGLIKLGIGTLEDLSNIKEIWPFLFPEEKEKINIAFDVNKHLQERVGKLTQEDLKGLEECENAILDIKKRYDEPLRQVVVAGFKRYLIKSLKEIKVGSFTKEDKRDILIELDRMINELKFFTEEEKRQLIEEIFSIIENLPEKKVEYQIKPKKELKQTPPPTLSVEDIYKLGVWIKKGWQERKKRKLTQILPTLPPVPEPKKQFPRESYPKISSAPQKESLQNNYPQIPPAPLTPIEYAKLATSGIHCDILEGPKQGMYRVKWKDWDEKVHIDWVARSQLIFPYEEK